MSEIPAPTKPQMAGCQQEPYSSLVDLVDAMAANPCLVTAKALAKGLKAAGRTNIEIAAVMNCSPYSAARLLR